MTNDLTKGNPAKLILFFTFPYLIGNVFQLLYNAADTFIVGRTLGVNALAAVGATGGLVWFAMGFVQGVCTGFSVITAQCFGSGDKENLKKSFSMSIILSVILAVVMTCACTLGARQLLEFINTPPEIIDISYRYMFIIFAGLPATTMYNLLSNEIRALGNSKTPLLFLIIASVINIALDYVFILAFKTGAQGAGYATVIAQLASGIMCIAYIVKKVPELHLTKAHFVIDCPMIKKLLRVGLPMGLLNMILSIGVITMQWATNRISTDAVATYTAASRLEQFGNLPLQSFGASISVYAAQNYGAGDIKRVRRGVNSCMAMSMVWVAAAVIMMAFLGKSLIRLFVGPDAGMSIVSDGYSYILISSVLMVFLAPLVIYKSVVQALGRAFIPTLSGFVEVVCRAGVAIFMASRYGFIALCFASPSAWVGALILIAPEYFMCMKRLSGKCRDKSETAAAV